MPRGRGGGMQSRAPRQGAAARWGHRALPQRDTRGAHATGHERGARQRDAGCKAAHRGGEPPRAMRRGGAMGTSRPTAKPHEVCAGEGRGMQNRTRGGTQRDTSVGGAWGREAKPHGGARRGGRGGDRMKYFITEKTGMGRIFVFIFGLSTFGFRGLKFFLFGMVAKESISCYSGFTCRGYFAIECS